MWIVRGQPKTVKMSYALAKEFAEMEPCPHDRPLRESRLAELTRRYESGEFRVCTWASAYCAETKKTYRINGKHTSTMFNGMNGQLKKNNPVYVTLEEFNCDTLEDVAKLYATFDTKLSARSCNDIYRAFCAVDPDLADIPPQIMNTTIAGIAFANWEGESSRSHQPEERAALALENTAFCRWVVALMLGGDCRHIRRAPAIAAMFKTWNKAKKESTDFWTLVRDGSGPKHTTPDRVLNKYLLTNSVNSGTGRRPAADTREMYVKCIHGWNAWRRNESTTLQYYPTSKTPAAA